MQHPFQPMLRFTQKSYQFSTDRTVSFNSIGIFPPQTDSNGFGNVILHDRDNIKKYANMEPDLGFLRLSELA